MNNKFSWSQLGNIAEGRPNLGDMSPVAVYRLMQYTMRATLHKEFGDEATRRLFFNAGKLAGKEFCKNLLDNSLEINTFLTELYGVLIELKIGILRVEKSDIDNLCFVITVSEDLDCSGLPISGETVCDYDEGFIAGIFEIYTGIEFEVKEIDCWSTGERTCRFTVEPKNWNN